MNASESILRTLDVKEIERLRQLGKSRGHKRKAQDDTRITPVSREQPMALSFAQQRLWFLAQLEGDSATYHIPMGLHLRGKLDVAAWRHALDTIWSRHEALRSHFVKHEGEPQLALLPAVAGMPWQEEDVPGEADAASYVRQRAMEEIHHAFDLEQGPLIRASLIRVTHDEHIFLLTQHHIVSDGWSIGVLVHELNELYRAFSDGRSNPFEPLAIQYADYAHWQREWLSGERLAMQTAYWKQQLADIPLLLELPTDRVRPSRQSFAASHVPIHIDETLSASLLQLSQQHGVTLFMTLLAAWSSVLSRLSGQEDVVIGSPSANRQHPQIEGLIGFFVNTLALRIDLSGTPTVIELLERVRRTVLEAQVHQDLPFEQVVEIVQPPRQMGQTPIFQVMLAWQNNTIGDLTLAGVQAGPLDLTWDSVKCDIELQLGERGGCIEGVLSYATALFDEATIARHRDYLLATLQAMVTDAQQAMARISMLSDAERRLLLETWNSTEAAYPQDACIHQLFEEQVRCSPDAIAVVYGEERLSYGELNRRANRLAHGLIKEGVKPDERVAICVERSSHMVVGLLGILKAGGAYVPIDPAYPEERRSYMLKDAAPRIVLMDAATRKAWRGPLPDALTVLELDAERPAWTDQAEHNPAVDGLTSHHLAYVIYTSGSTGLPKGVPNEHKALANRLQWMQDAYALRPHDVVAQKTPYSFDVSVWEFFWTLQRGATLAVMAPGSHRDANQLARWIIEQGVTTAHFVPSMLGSFLEAQEASLCTTLTRVICSGEALPAAMVRRFAQILPGAALHNLYGPTEAAIDVTAWTCPDHFDDEQVPIGRPIANTQIYLLDKHQQPVPRGSLGEIYIGGAGVARGYLHRPELTSERFLPDPFSKQTDAKMYRTGDLAKYLPDGNIVYLGRNDHQVKIRGFRIELGEIEARLGEYADVREAVVVAREDRAGEKKLVAYVVPHGHAVADDLAATLRAYLSERLPDYMVPRAFVHLDALPLTPNGKLDRKTLPAPDEEAYARQTYEAPQGAIEQTLAQIWQELLGVERVGRQDNFFALGGHSLLAVRLLSRLRNVFHIELPLSRFFDALTLVDVAGVIADPLLVAKVAMPAITRLSRERPLPPSFAQQRLWFLSQLEGVSATYHMPLVLRLQRALDVQALRRSLDAIWSRHESLRSMFRLAEGAPIVDLLPTESGMPWQEESVPSEADAAGYVQQRAMEEIHQAFDLEHGPLIRARLIHVTDDEHIFLLTQHHIVSDGWSIGVLMHELNELYCAFSNGQNDPLAPLAIQYADYAHWQRQWLSGERLAMQAAYWKQQLADIPVLLELPTDRVRPTRQRFAGAHVPIHLDEALTASLRQLSQQHGVTLFMTLLAAWSSVLSRLSGQEDLVIGSPSANRQHPQIEGLIGFFVNTLALRIDLSGTPTVIELLERVRRTVLEAQVHQDLPFEQVVEIVQPPRKMGQTPIFQVMLAWQNNEAGDLALPDVQVGPLDLTWDSVKYDIELQLGERDGCVEGALSYATALFDEATIVRHRDYLLATLRAMVADAQRAVARIPLLGDAERRLLLETWHATEQSYPPEKCIHQLFEEQVIRSPDAIALTMGDEQLSYAELNARANRVAHRLIEEGVQPDDRVAICMERSLDLVIGLLGILKAGGGYVPLDPAYPGERLHWILDDASPTQLMSDAVGREVLGHVEYDVLDIATLASDKRQPATNPAVTTLGPSHLAYVIYTSGSTGTPKGVMVEHQQVTRLFDATDPWYGFDANDVWCLFHSYAFDFSVWEMWGALRYGGRLVVVPREIAKSAQDFYDLACRTGVTVLNQTPSAFRSFIDAQARSPQTHRLRYVIFGGEALELAMLKGWYARNPEHAPTLINMYGITETTVHVTYRALTHADTQMSISPIGQCIPDLRAYVLDAHQQPVPLGAVGEMYIGGEGVARGYLNRPALTAERFLRDPFHANPDARMYRTGDLAKYLPDGSLVYLGRNDHQVKIRGFRIELGEIEARLSEHARVRDAVVVAREGANGEKRLVAYVVPHGHAEGDDLNPVLRAHLSERLPDYMVPSAFVRMESLPLTPNGKLDHKALPVPDDDAYARERYEAPQGGVEQILAHIWQELLDVERVGRYDNFFALGGHSLLAMRMIQLLHLGSEYDVPLTALYESPTIAGLAERLTAPGQVVDHFRSREILLPLRSDGDRATLFCMHPGAGIGWAYLGLLRHLPGHPIYTLQSRGHSQAAYEAESIHAMAADYLMNIQTVQPKGPYHLLGWSIGGYLAHAVATLLQEKGEQVKLLVILDSYPVPEVDRTSAIPNGDELEQFIRRHLGEMGYTTRDLDDALVASMAKELEMSAVLMQEFEPGVFHGDLLFFRACDDTAERPPVEAWKPFVAGDMAVHGIDCDHGAMMQTGPLTKIGPILFDALALDARIEASAIHAEDRVCDEM